MSEKLIEKVKENYQLAIDEYKRNQEHKKEFGLAKLFFDNYELSFVPVFMNDLIDIIKTHNIKYTQSEGCNLYQINVPIPETAFEFKPEIMEYKEDDNGKLISNIIPNQDAGDFRTTLEKAFDYFMEVNKVKEISNLIFYKQDNWKGCNFYIEGLIKKHNNE